MTEHSFNKQEKLCKRTLINNLFETGKSFVQYPIKVVWLYNEEVLPYPAQAGFAVSKRLFKNAVDRNLIKRRMRETYRQNKHILYNSLNQNNKNLIAMFIYIGKDIVAYKDSELKIVLSLQELITINEKGN